MRLSRFFPLISFFFLMMAASSFAQDKPDPRKYPEPQNQPEQQNSPQYSDQSGSAQDSPGYGNQPEQQDQQATPDSQDQQRQPDYNNQTDQQSAPQYGNQADQQGQQPAPDDRDRQYSPDDRRQPDQQYPPDPRTQPRAELPPPSRPEPSQEWMPDAIAYLRQNASSKTEFNLDHSMVVLASKIDDNDPDLRRVVAGVDGVSIHRFHFDGYGMYDPRVLADVRQQYRTAGWQHISKGHGRNGGPGQTDFWVQLDNMTIRNVAVLFTGPNQVTLVSVSCAISPIDLTHLGGHFGIPQMQGGIVLPRARNDSRPYQPQGY